ncbi:hypothetical protein GOQ27_11040 [Clostridium sp. D2Q-11]|uniref:Uncharacterized protein n=1 Tax=Anaeromonas frigoriresistens TaxID=2683708 RepID=A0A942UY74_9FIRM|nr:hypothetical protein [Anaeromonas frigoriresistens]MBS4538999.1 hypothetical protein [Anaeromonas frigoriresistens]
MGVKLGILTLYSGSIWASFFEHTLNNTDINLIHVTTNNGTDSMQIVRVVLTQILSLIIVYIYSVKKKKSQTIYV